MPAISLAAFLENRSAAEPIANDIAATILAVAVAAFEVWRAGQDATLVAGGIETGINPDGDRQIALDVLADRIFLEATRKAPVAATRQRSWPIRS